ncbi:MAG: ATP-binding cassette domain-containing protein [Thermoplasmata archaeon]
MTDAIVTEGLGKTYPGGVEAVREVTFSVRRGEVFGLLGPNGAGKTTLTSLLTTVLRPSRGRAEVEGFDVVRDAAAVRQRIGLVFQRSTADGTLTGRENLEIAAGLYGIGRSAARPRVRSLLERMGLREAADRPARSYSGGMQRRLEIAVALIHEPQTLFLDEPTLGLDPQARAAFWQFVRDLRASRGVTICLTTHHLEEADRLCDRVAILDGGSVRTAGTPAELKDRLGGDVVVLRPAQPRDDLEAALSGVAGVLRVEPTPDGAFRVRVRRSESVVPALVRACDGAGIELAEVSTRKPSLDEVFLSVTGREYRSAADGTEWLAPTDARAPRGG